MSEQRRRPWAVLILAVLALGALALLSSQRERSPDSDARPRETLAEATSRSPELQAPGSVEATPSPAEVHEAPRAAAVHEAGGALAGQAFEDPVDPSDPVHAETGLRGRVVDAAGRPVAGAEVQLRGTKPGGMRMIAVRREGGGQPEMRIAGETRSAVVTSDDDGRFEVLGLSPRHRYTIHVEPTEAFLPARQPAPALQERQVVEAGDVTVSRPGALAGVVLGPQGEPLAGVQVVLGEPQGLMMLSEAEDVDVSAEEGEGEGEERQERRTMAFSYSMGAGAGPGPGGAGLPDLGAMQATRSDEAGRFEFARVAPGEHLLSARRKGLREARREGVEVREGQRTDGVTLELRAGLALEVVIRDTRGQTVPEAEVLVVGRRERVATTNAQGVALIDGLPGPELMLHVQAEGYAALDVQLQLDPEQEGAERRELVLRAGATVVGRVVRERDGEPVTQGFVWPQPLVHGGSVRMVSSGDDGRLDETGRFELSGIAPGRYRLSVRSPGLAPGSLELEVPEGQPRVDAGELRLGALGGLQVTVLDPQGAPVRGAQVELGRGGPGGSVEMVVVQAVEGEEEEEGEGDAPTFMSLGNQALTDEAGQATLEDVEPGQQDLRVVKAGFAPGYASVEVPSDGTTARVSVTLSQGGRVRGHLLRGGAAVAGARVWLLREGRGAPVDQVSTTSDGDFAFERVTAGRYRLRVPELDLLGEVRWFQVEEGREQEQLLEAAPACGLEGRVTDANGVGLAGVRLALGHVSSFLPGDPVVQWALAETTSGADGAYRFDGLPGGRSGLAVTATLAEGAKHTFAVELPESGTAQADLALPGAEGGVEVTALVWNELESAPGAGVQVELASQGSGALLRRVRQAGSDGRVRFPRIPPGSYRLTVAEGAYARTQVELEVGSGPPAAPTLTLRPGVALRVDLAGRPGDRARTVLELRDEEDDVGPPRFGFSELGDGLVFDGLSPGATYRLRVRAEGYAEWSGTVRGGAEAARVRLSPE